jgi:DNA-binding LacI/PurR family transcriptional regulator
MEQKTPAPLYQVIIEELKARIEDGDFEYDSPFCTEKGLCARYGVSRITAKRAVEELEREGRLYRKRGVGSFVVPRSERAEYRLPAPPPGADSRAIALILPFNITQGGILKTIEAATAALTPARRYLTLHVSQLGAENERAMLQTLLDNHTDGVVYYPSSAVLPTDVLDRFRAAGKPVVILDKPHENPGYSGVTCDNFEGGRLLTEHLLNYGHRSICYLSRYSPEEAGSVRDRFAGYARSLSDNGIAAPPRFVRIDTPQDGMLDYPLLKHTVSALRRENVTAIECENDEVAFHVYMCCRSLSIRMPEDMSIAGFDNIHWATTGNARITTVEQDFAGIGSETAALLLRPNGAPARTVVPVRLVPRDSTGPLSG